MQNAPKRFQAKTRRLRHNSPPDYFMPSTPYDPAIHHRHSIRLKGHDYAGGGVYFVTICAHRNAGNIFAPPAVKAMIAREWESAVAGVRAGVGAGVEVGVGAGVWAGFMSAQGRHKACPYVIMPDHFHALIRMPRRVDVGGGHKDRPYVGRCDLRLQIAGGARIHRGGENRPMATFPRRLLAPQLLRDDRARCGGRGEYRALHPPEPVAVRDGVRQRPARNGQPDAVERAETRRAGIAGRGGVLWADTRGADTRPAPTEPYVIMGGFHSPMEREILDRLLAGRLPVIWCPAWGVGADTRPAPTAAHTPATLAALEENRMLILEMTQHDGNLASAEARNRFVLEQADKLWLPHVTPGGLIDRLVREMRVQDKVLNHGIHG